MAKARFGLIANEKLIIIKMITLLLKIIILYLKLVVNFITETLS